MSNTLRKRKQLHDEFLFGKHQRNQYFLFMYTSSVFSLRLVNLTTPRSTQEREGEWGNIFIHWFTVYVWCIYVCVYRRELELWPCSRCCNWLSCPYAYLPAMKTLFVRLILLVVLLFPVQISSASFNDPFEYFKKLTRDTQVYSQCDLIPPFQVQLDGSFFDSDLRQWQRKKNPPPVHRALEAFVQLDTLRQSTYFSQILQGNSQARVPGINFVSSQLDITFTLRHSWAIFQIASPSIPAFILCRELNYFCRLKYENIDRKGEAVQKYHLEFHQCRVLSQTLVKMTRKTSLISTRSMMGVQRRYWLHFFGWPSTVRRTPLLDAKEMDQQRNLIPTPWFFF